MVRFRSLTNIRLLQYIYSHGIACPRYDVFVTGAVIWFTDAANPEAEVQDIEQES